MKRLDSMVPTHALAAVAFGVLVLVPGPLRASDPTEEVVAACRSELPKKLAAAADAGAQNGSSAAGRWSIHAGEMDGAGSAEALLVILPTNKPGKVVFVAARPDKDPVRKNVKLGGSPLVSASVSFTEFAPGRSLAHVDGGESGQRLLYWNGKDLKDVWKAGRPAPGESRWFDLEDLDGDGTAEVVIYVRRDLDTETDDEFGISASGMDRQASAQVDALEVHRLKDGKWKKDKKLLESLR